MIYAYDQAIQLPVRDIYDTQIMMASINAARDMYERGQKQMEDFYKNYGDFFSPIGADMDWYNRNVIGAARDFVNNLYENGVDPLRSPEGRQLVARFVNSVPVGEINKRKQAAAAAQEYIKARGQLEAKGLWNPDYEKFLLNGRSLEDWDTARDGLWTRTSPAEFSDLNAATTAWFNQLKPSYLRTEDGYDYFGVSPEAMDRVTASQIPGFIDSNLGRYHYDLARRQLVAAGIDPTPQNIMNRLRDNIRSANSEVLLETRELNPVSKMDLELEQYKKKAAIDDYYDRLKEQRKAEREAKKATTTGTDVEGHNWDAQLYGSIVTNLLGNNYHWSEMGPEEYRQAGNVIRSNAQVWANDINNRGLNNDMYRRTFISKYTIPADFQSLIQRQPRTMTDHTDTFVANASDVERLVTMDDLLRNTEGFEQDRIPTRNSTKNLKKKIEEAGLDNVQIQVHEQAYGAPLKNSTNIVPRQVVTVKIKNADGTVENIECGYRIGPDSRGYELLEGPNSSRFMNSRVISNQPTQQDLPINAIPNVYNTTYSGFGNKKISTLYGDSSQGIKYNGIIPIQ